MAMFIIKPWYRKKDDAIYGAEWAGGSDPSWVRTDAAVGFTNPNPYYSGMSTTPSSPFDNIMPWSGMRRVTDANAGELVEIPKFYYKWTRDGVKMKLQISMSAFDGSHVSPAHADRGDGIGERDYVYVGRYHCSSSDFKSTSGVKPKSNISISTCRSGIASLGQYVWQYDFASYWTIMMLYLVEFANWNAQAVIGMGEGNGSSIENNGASDNMPYHTGTMQTSRNTKGVGVQYRYIEDLWANVIQYLDGVYANNLDVYCIKNPANFSDSSGGTKVGTRTAAYSGTSGYITAFSTPIATGFEYAIYPNEANGGSESTYITDNYYYSSGGTKFRVGGFYVGGKADGPFHFHVYSYYSPDPRPEDSCRLMVLPPSRLSA